MKALLLLTIVIGGAALLGTRRGTPFLRWGLVLAVAGVALISSAALFTARGVMYGFVLFGIGAAVYYYGRLVRGEQLSLPKTR